MGGKRGMQATVRGTARAVFGLCVAGLAASFAGALHGAADSLAVIRLPMALLAALCVPGLPARWRIGGGGLAGIAALTVVVPHLAVGQAHGSGPSAVTLYQKNTLYTLADPGPLIADIRASGTQIVTFQEVLATSRGRLLGPLADILPGQHWCASEPVGGTAVLTALPVIPGSKGCSPGMAWLQVQTEQAGPVWVVAIHLKWPWPHRQPSHARQMRKVLERLDGPVILAGDFNAVPAMAVSRGLSGAVGARPARPAQVSFHLRGLPFTIDHVFGPRGGMLERRPMLGSDHFGLLARLPLQ